MPPQDNDLQHKFIGDALRGILSDLRQMDNRVRALENENAVGTDPALSQVGFSSNNMMGIFAFPVKVTEVTTASCKFRGGVLKPGFSACDPWVIDTDITTTIHVHVTTSLCLPEVDEVCLAQHVGPYYTGGDWTAKYGLFDLIRYLRVLDSSESTVVYPSKELQFSSCFAITEPSPGRAFIDYICDTDSTTYVRDIRHFEMTAALNKLNCGAPVTATFVDGAGCNGTSAETFEAYDVLNKFMKPLSHPDSASRGNYGTVTWSKELERWEVIEMEPPAARIEFSSTEDMSKTETGKMSASVDDYFRGHDPDDFYWGASVEDFRVLDSEGLFPDALSGAKGLATWNDRAGLYEIAICQQRAQIVEATAGEDFDEGTDPVLVNSGVIMNLTRDQFNPVESSSARNIFKCRGDSGDKVCLAWSDSLKAYVLINPYKSNVRTIGVTGCATSGSCGMSPSVAVTNYPMEIVFNCDWFSVAYAGTTSTVDFSPTTSVTTFITGLQVSGLELQVTYQSGTLLCPGTPSGWVEIATGTECATV